MKSNEEKVGVWKMFNQISVSYDLVNRIVSLGQDRKWRHAAAINLPPRPHLNILDLATGTGDQLVALEKSGFSIRRMVGIDLADEMMEIGKKKQIQRAEFIHADAQNLPFRDSEFDAATISFGIRNIPSPLLALKEMYRVLKPGGRALVLEFSLPNRAVRPFYLFYLRKILPLLGGVFSKNFSAYRYLNRTIESFPSGEEFLTLMHDAGFSQLRRRSMNLGSVSLYIGEKTG